MADNNRKRKRSQLSLSSPLSNPRSKGFSSRDQRLPASPPNLTSTSAHAPRLLSAVRARYRDALDLLFGTPTTVLNASCTAPPPNFSPRRPAKHPRSETDGRVGENDQVVPNGTAVKRTWQNSCNHQCQCASNLWVAGGVGPELMLRTAEELSERILVLYAKAVDPKTSNVDYSSLIHSDNFHQYLMAARKLRYFDPLLLSDLERKSFFLNVYNSLMIHALAVMSKPVSMYDRVSLYNAASYNIGGRPYSLNMIEHGVLRGNRPGCGPFAQPPFTESDARKLCMLPKVDPRIHFALNCGARSCPSVRFYEARTLDRTLDAATHVYLQDVEVDEGKRLVTLPKLLQWYRHDFSDKGDVDALIRWTLPYLDEKKRVLLETLLEEKKLGEGFFKIVYAGYDWTVNDTSM